MVLAFDSQRGLLRRQVTLALALRVAVLGKAEAVDIGVKYSYGGCEAVAIFPVLGWSLLFSTPLPPLPRGSNGIIELGENREVIYELLLLRGKILSPKGLGCATRILFGPRGGAMIGQMIGGRQGQMSQRGVHY